MTEDFIKSPRSVKESYKVMLLARNFFTFSTVSAGLWLACLILMFSAIFPMAAQSQSRLGSSFNCANPASLAAEIVCASDYLRRLDLKQMQTYYTVRHAFPSRVGEYRQIYLDSLKAADDLCGLANTQNRQQSIECLGRAFEELNRRWESIIAGFSDRSALNEIQISVDDKILIQRQLRSRSFLPGNAAEDGIYGTGVRSAISQFQRANGFAVSGFLSGETARALLPSSTPPQFSTTNDQSRTPVQTQTSTRSLNLDDEKNSVVIFLAAIIIFIIWILYKTTKFITLSNCPACGRKGSFKKTGAWKEPKSSFIQTTKDNYIQGQTNYRNTAYELGVIHTTRACRSCGFTKETQKNYRKEVSTTMT